MNNNDLDGDLSDLNNKQTTSASQVDNRNIAEDLSGLNIQSTSTSEADEEFDVKEAIEDLAIFFSNLTELLSIMAAINNIEMFNDVRSKLISGEITYPSCFKHIVTKYFKLSSKPKKKEYKLVGKEFSNYLKQFLKVNNNNSDNNNNNITNHPSLEDDVTYDELIKFLKSCKSTISNDEQRVLKNECIYGFFLEKFIIEHMCNRAKGRTNLNNKVILKKEFNLSESYVRKLRWLGKLWSKHSKIGNLCISFSTLYNFKEQLETIFINPKLAAEWI